MWEFLTQVLERGGVVAAIQVLVLCAVGIFIRWAWSDQKRLHRLLREQHIEHAKQLAELQERLNDLQERRVREAQRVTQQVVEHTAHVDRSMEKLAASLSVLIEFSGGRR